MDKCPKCGNKLSSIDVLCPRCGTLVEVVQIKKSAGVQSASGTYGSPAKKVPQQNLIVYNDDLPSDDIFSSVDSEPEAVDISEPIAPTPENTETAPYILPEAEPEVHSEETDFGSEADYLALLRKMNLSALDDFSEPASSSDLEQEPTLSADNDIDALASVPNDTEPEPIPFSNAPHRWLEIEELAEAEVSQPQPIPIQATHTQSAQAQPTEVPSVAPLPPIFLSSEEQRRYHANNGKNRKSASQHSVGRVILMVFVWLVITCAVFCGFYFFDQYVIGHYGSYQAMLYEISDGQIQFETSADKASESSESP